MLKELGHILKYRIPCDCYQSQVQIDMVASRLELKYGWNYNMPCGTFRPWHHEGEIVVSLAKVLFNLKWDVWPAESKIRLFKIEL